MEKGSWSKRIRPTPFFGSPWEHSTNHSQQKWICRVCCHAAEKKSKTSDSKKIPI